MSWLFSLSATTSLFVLVLVIMIIIIFFLWAINYFHSETVLHLHFAIYPIVLLTYYITKHPLVTIFLSTFFPSSQYHTQSLHYPLRIRYDCGDTAAAVRCDWSSLTTNHHHHHHYPYPYPHPWFTSDHTLGLIVSSSSNHHHRHKIVKIANFMMIDITYTCFPVLHLSPTLAHQPHYYHWLIVPLFISYESHNIAMSLSLARSLSLPHIILFPHFSLRCYHVTVMPSSVVSQLDWSLSLLREQKEKSPHLLCPRR